MNAATGLVAVPVDGAALMSGVHGHVLSIDGRPATITAKTRTAAGVHVVEYALLGDGIDDPATGTIYLPDGATVDCIRYSGWLGGDSEAAR